MQFFHFFSFLLIFGGWQGNHFVQNFMENNSIENFEAWKSRESAENCLIRCASKLSLIVVHIDRIGLYFGDLRSKLRYDISQVESESTLELSGSVHFLLFLVNRCHFETFSAQCKKIYPVAFFSGASIEIPEAKSVSERQQGSWKKATL